MTAAGGGAAKMGRIPARCGATIGRMTQDRPAPTISVLSRDDAPELLDLDQWAFGFDSSEHDTVDPVLDLLEWGRVYGARLPGPGGSGDRLAGIYGAYSVDCPLPGGTSAPAAGLTWVGVHPRDRRRGVLSAMIRHHLDDVRTRRGEPFSLLFAAEPAIYGRFGYGLASRGTTFALGRGTALRDVAGADDLVIDIEHADADRHAKTLAACYAAAAARRPGCISRTAEGATRFPFYDPPRTRRGAESLRVITATAPDGDLRGYALFRRRMRWDDGMPNGTVEVREIITQDAAACRALWGRLTDLDLTAKVETLPLAVDDPLLHLLVDPRAAAPRLYDGLWCRLVDVPAALTARRYATEVDLVLEVTDPQRPDNAGRWHLAAGPTSARCERTERPPHLTLDVRELGNAFLGGITLTALAASGLVTVHDPAALVVAAVAFGSPIAPWCAWEF